MSGERTQHIIIIDDKMIRHEAKQQHGRVVVPFAEVPAELQSKYKYDQTIVGALPYPPKDWVGQARAGKDFW